MGRRIPAEFGIYGLLLVILVAVGGFSWLTHNPESDVLVRAQEWPVVGPLAERFRRTYLPLDEGAYDTRTRTAEYGEVIVERAETIELSPRGELIWLLPGAVLRSEPQPAAPVVREIDAISNAYELGQQGPWFRVFLSGQEGWVFLPDYQRDRDPPYGEEPLAPGPLPPQAPEPEALATAREFIGAEERQVSVGPYTLYTDCDDPKLLAHLDLLAGQLEHLFQERYGVRPMGTPKAALVLYRDEADYRQLQAASTRLAGLKAVGHHSRGLAAFYVGDRPHREVGSTLVHELAHTLTRRAIGPALPAWLDEGIADDLSMAHVDPDGTIVLDQLSGGTTVDGSRLTIDGAYGSLWQLRQAKAEGRLPTIPELLALPWEDFVRDDSITMHYDASAFWIRYLLEAEGGRRASGFQAFLASVAEGAPPSADQLESKMDEPLHLLGAKYRLWLEVQADQLDLPEAEAPQPEESEPEASPSDGEPLDA